MCIRHFVTNRLPYAGAYKHCGRYMVKVLNTIRSSITRRVVPKDDSTLFQCVRSFLRYRQFANLSEDDSRPSPSLGVTPVICPRQCCEDRQSGSHSEDAGDDTGR